LKKPINIGVGKDKNDPISALEESLDDGDITDPDIVFVSFTPNLDPNEVRKDIVSQIDVDETLVLGVSSAGNLTGDGYTRGAAVLTMKLTQLVVVGVGMARDASENPREKASEAVRRSTRGVKRDISAALAPAATGIVKGGAMDVVRHSMADVLLLVSGVLGDPWGPREILLGVLDEVMSTVPRIVGGVAANEYDFEAPTYVFDAEGVHEDAVTVLSVFTSLRRGYAVDHGFQPVGEPVKVETEGTLVKRIEGKPALEYYAEVIGTSPESIDETILLTHPLGVPDPGPREYVIIRTPIGVEGDSIRLVSPLKSNFAHLMTRGDVRGSFERSVRAALESAGGEASLVFLFNCAARHLVVDSDEAIDIVTDVVGEDTPVFGFNCYGEFGPTPSGSIMHHNQTVTVYVVGRGVMGH